MKKRFLILIICICVLAGAAVSASGISSQDSIVVSRSYLEGTYLQELISFISVQISNAKHNVKNEAQERLDGLGQGYLDQLEPLLGPQEDWQAAGSFVDQGGEMGDTITLVAGSGLVWTGGTASFSGTLIDITDGTEIVNGNVTEGHRYVAATETVVTVNSDIAYWAVEGEWTTTSDGVPKPRVVFTDVPAGSWYYDPVYFVVERGLFIGTSETQFSPKATMNRGMLATVLYRMAGEPEVTYSPIFTDVKDGSWYAPGIVWAAQSGVIASDSETCKPLEDLTRQEIGLMLYNYAAWKGIDTSERADLSIMKDGDQVSDWALDAMSWNVAKGIFIGSGENLNPLDTTNRAEVATVLLRFDALFAE